MSGQRILLACVGEDRPAFHANIETLVGSARWLGGPLADGPIVVNMVERADRAFVERMQALGAQVRIVPRFQQGGVAQLNKLRMFELGERDDFDVLLAVDCDVAVADDPAGRISSGSISAAPADKDPFTDVHWRQIFDGLGLWPCERQLRSGRTGREMYPYFNSGVLGVPRELCAELLEAWREALVRLGELWLRRPQIVSQRALFYSDQLAFAVALARGLPWVAASRELNFPTHVPLHGPTVAGLRPALLHHHSQLDERGFLLRPRSSVAVQAADRVNCARAEALGIAYRGLRNPPVRARASIAVLPVRQRVRRVADRLTGRAPGS